MRFRTILVRFRTLFTGLKAAQEEERGKMPPPPPQSVMEYRVRGVLEIIKSPDIQEETKNAALRSITEKIVYAKPQNCLNIYFTF